MGFVVIWLICAGVTSVIAVNKGRSGLGWFFIGALLGIFGIVLIACLSPIGQQTHQAGYHDQAIASRITSTASYRRMKVCPDCAEEVLADARLCKHCRHQFPEPKLPEQKHFRQPRWPD